MFQNCTGSSSVPLTSGPGRPRCARRPRFQRRRCLPTAPVLHRPRRREQQARQRGVQRREDGRARAREEPGNTTREGGRTRSSAGTRIATCDTCPQGLPGPPASPARPCSRASSAPSGGPHNPWLLPHSKTGLQQPPCPTPIFPPCWTTRQRACAALPPSLHPTSPWLSLQQSSPKESPRPTPKPLLSSALNPLRKNPAILPNHTRRGRSLLVSVLLGCWVWLAPRAPPPWCKDHVLSAPFADASFSPGTLNVGVA